MVSKLRPSPRWRGNCQKNEKFGDLRSLNFSSLRSTGLRDDGRGQLGEVVDSEEGLDVDAEGQTLFQMEGEVLRHQQRLPQLLQEGHVQDLRDGRVPVQGKLQYLLPQRTGNKFPLSQERLSYDASRFNSLY